MYFRIKYENVNRAISLKIKLFRFRINNYYAFLPPEEERIRRSNEHLKEVLEVVGMNFKKILPIGIIDKMDNNERDKSVKSSIGNNIVGNQVRE